MTKCTYWPGSRYAALGIEVIGHCSESGAIMGTNARDPLMPLMSRYWYSFAKYLPVPVLRGMSHCIEEF